MPYFQGIFINSMSTYFSTKRTYCVLDKHVTIIDMVENIQKNKKPLIIGILLVAVFAFLLLTGGNSGGNSNTASSVPLKDDTTEVATSTDAESDVATTTASTTAQTTQTEDIQSVTEEMMYTGTGGGVQDILDLSDDTSADTDTAESSDESGEDKSEIVERGEAILNGIGLLSDEEIEQLKPDLLALIAALEALIEDLENYIEYLESEQS